MHHHAEKKVPQQAGEPSKSDRMGVARIQTCSDDEDFAVLDLGGGYCSSSDGSDEGWRPHNDAAITYQAPRCEYHHMSRDPDPSARLLDSACARFPGGPTVKTKTCTCLAPQRLAIDMTEAAAGVRLSFPPSMLMTGCLAWAPCQNSFS